MNIYVGNLTSDVTEKDLHEVFGAFGTLTSVNILTNARSGESRGFGFVEMALEAEAQAAIDGLDGMDYQGKNLKVAAARPSPERHRKNQ